MPYATIQPPFTLNFREMPRKELKQYFSWFQSMLPQRLSELRNAVKTTPGFEGWEADLTPESLDRLGEWFAGHVETRQRTQDEIEQIAGRSAYPIEIPSEELTNRTFSLSIDVGMYISQVFLKHHSTLRWDQPFGNKKDVDYGQPVLLGFGVMPFSPVQMMVTLAYGMARKDKTGSRLREIYDIWTKMIRP